MLGHDLARALRHQQEAVEIAITALPARAADQLQEFALLARRCEPDDARIKQRRVGQLVNIRNAKPALVPPGAITAQGPIDQAPQSWQAGDAGDLFATILQADES